VALDEEKSDDEPIKNFNTNEDLEPKSPRRWKKHIIYHSHPKRMRIHRVQSTPSIRWKIQIWKGSTLYTPAQTMN
jgi:hypothetical protein